MSGKAARIRGTRNGYIDSGPPSCRRAPATRSAVLAWLGNAAPPRTAAPATRASDAALRSEASGEWGDSVSSTKLGRADVEPEVEGLLGDTSLAPPGERCAVRLRHCRKAFLPGVAGSTDRASTGFLESRPDAEKGDTLLRQVDGIVIIISRPSSL